MRYIAIIMCAAFAVGSAWAAQSEATPAAPAPEAPTLSETAPVAAAPGATAQTPEEQEYRRQAAALYESLHRRTGNISIAGGKVQLNVPATHYFIGAEEARHIIVDIWG